MENSSSLTQASDEASRLINAKASMLRQLLSRVNAFTPREQQVLAQLGVDVSNRELARRPGITERTVKAHITQILKKLNVNRTEAAILAFGITFQCMCGRTLLLNLGASTN